MKNLEEYIEWMLGKQKSPRTVQNYCYELKKFPEELEKQLEYVHDMKDKKMLIFAYRSYLHFLKKKKTINREQLLDLLDTITPPKKRGEARSKKKGKKFPRDQWGAIVRKGPNKIAKFGIWIGFHFGLRLSEIVYLRVRDVDLEKMIINITAEGREKEQIEIIKGYSIFSKWTPKHFKERVVSINSKEQVRVFERWIKEDRPKDLNHEYLLWSPTTLGKLKDRTFQRWCKQAHPELRPHDLRRSF